MKIKKTIPEETRLALITILTAQHHKGDTDPDDWFKVHINLIVLAAFTLKWCKEQYLEVTFTSIIRPKIPGVSKTDIHASGRAFDLSVQGWTIEQIDLFVKTLNEIFTIGAISFRDGKEREAVYEDGVTAGKGPHLHVQCRA